METKEKEEIGLEERKVLMLNLLDIFLNYCKKNDLQVYLGGGTLLGAVRHRGYIPWDDDIDVIMPITDCEKLIGLIETNPLPEPYHFSTPQNNPYHMWPFYKMIDFRTVLIEPITTKKRQKQQKQYYGIYIDIFPMYGLPNNDNEKKRFQDELCLLYEKFKKATRVMNRRSTDNYFLYKTRSILYFIYSLPNKIIGGEYYLNRMFAKMKQYSLAESEQFGFTAGLTTGNKDHVDTSNLDHITFLDFETLKCPVLACYDSMLKNQYGDYMMLPPVGQRHMHPSNVKWRKEWRED